MYKILNTRSGVILMVWAVDYMQKVIVRNLTGKELKNIILSHNGEGGHESKVKRLKVNEEKTECLYTLREKDKCDLIFTCNYNNMIKREIIYDNLSCDSRPYIIIELRDSHGELLINTIIKKNSELET